MAKKSLQNEDKMPMFFSAYNYKLIAIAVGLIIAGFAAMLIENEVKGFVSLYVSPIIIMAGFVLVVFAILKHDRVGTDADNPN